MARLLYLMTSPRERSHSTKVTHQFLKEYAQHHPKDKIETFDLWQADIPSFDGYTIDAKYKVLHGLPHSREEAHAWDRVKEIFTHFSSADKFVFSVPMWNFHIPYRLKHYIDVITQPGVAFKVTPEGNYVGLVTGKPALLIYASGGTYRLGEKSEALDFQKPYMKMWLKFIGFEKIHEIAVDGTLTPHLKEHEGEAMSQAIKMANTF